MSATTLRTLAFVPDVAAIRLAILSGVLLLFRLASLAVVSQPGYTDAYYYADVAQRLSRGLGLTADFVWSPLELGTLPVVSHRFWMPMATVLQAAGIVPLGAAVGDFRAGQLAIVLVAAFVPAAAYFAARSLGAGERPALVAAALVGLGGLFAPAWVSVDGFAPAALLGTLFFISLGRAAAGSLPAGLVAGALVGALYLTRAETALFGLALLALASRPASRRPGLAGSAIALLLGGAWLARDLTAGTPGDVLGRTALLVRYEDFFAVRDPSTSAFVAALPQVFAAKVSALAANAVTFLFAFALVLVIPLGYGVRLLRRRSEVRAWVALAVLVFLAQSLVWTLHSTRGSYFHSLGAFVPFGVALAVVGADRLIASRRAELAPAWTWGTLLLVAAISAGALAQWEASFNGGYRTRAAALDAIPAGTFLAIDAAAWRWISGRAVLVTPSDGIEMAGCLVNVPDPHATAIVLEEAHFSAYDSIYRGGARPAWLGAPIERGPVKIFPIVGSIPCAIGFSR